MSPQQLVDSLLDAIAVDAKAAAILRAELAAERARTAELVAELQACRAQLEAQQVVASDGR